MALDTTRCDAAALEHTLTIGQRARAVLRPQDAQALSMRADISRWLHRFASNGDEVVGPRHLCVALADFDDPDAASPFDGYVFIDPRLTPTPRLQRGFAAHAVAHHIQYWHGSAYQGDATSRRHELVASCIAGAILTADGKPLASVHEAESPDGSARVKVYKAAHLASVSVHPDDLSELTRYGGTLGGGPADSASLVKACTAEVKRRDAAKKDGP